MPPAPSSDGLLRLVVLAICAIGALIVGALWTAWAEYNHVGGNHGSGVGALHALCAAVVLLIGAHGLLYAGIQVLF